MCSIIFYFQQIYLIPETINYLGKIINPDGTEIRYSDTLDSIRDGIIKGKDENLEDDKVAACFTVTDMTDGKDFTKSSSFEINNLHEEKEIEDKTNKVFKDNRLGLDFKEVRMNKGLHHHQQDRTRSQ